MLERRVRLAGCDFYAVISNRSNWGFVCGAQLGESSSHDIIPVLKLNTSLEYSDAGKCNSLTMLCRLVATVNFVFNLPFNYGF